ncbi:MFS transporter [Candidatus Uhrbacteria bacterium]|nr:MFS transporter [Candidatus Uhrbacteria bacterium]
MKKHIWLWTSYDLANSLASVTVAFYFSLWLVKERGASDLWVSLPMAIATFIRLITLPYFGKLSDQMGKRKPFLAVTTTVAAAALMALGWYASGVDVLTNGSLAVIVILFSVYQYCFQAALAFYMAYLADLAVAKSKEAVAGLGVAAGQMGNIIGLIVALPLAEQSGRPMALLLGGAMFLVVALPMLIWLPEAKRTSGQAVMASPKEMLRSLKDIRAVPGLLRYLLVFYLFADALLTLNAFVSLYLEEVGGMTDKTKTLVRVIGLLLASVLILTWVVFIIALALVTSPVAFGIVASLNGFAFGALFALSRAYYSDLAPRHRQGEFFGYYVLFERFASMIGPLLWSLVALLFIDLGADRYRFSVASLAILVALSYVLLRKVPEPKRL